MSLVPAIPGLAFQPSLVTGTDTERADLEALGKLGVGGSCGSGNPVGDSRNPAGGSGNSARDSGSSISQLSVAQRVACRNPSPHGQVHTAIKHYLPPSFLSL